MLIVMALSTEHPKKLLEPLATEAPIFGSTLILRGFPCPTTVQTRIRTVIRMIAKTQRLAAARRPKTPRRWQHLHHPPDAVFALTGWIVRKRSRS